MKGYLGFRKAMRTHLKTDLRIVFNGIFRQEPERLYMRGSQGGVRVGGRGVGGEKETERRRKEGRKTREGKLLYSNLVLFIERNVCPEGRNKSKPVWRDLVWICHRGST